MKVYMMQRTVNYNSNLACSHIFHERFLQKYWKNQYFSSIGRKNCCSVAKLCLILCNPMDCSTPVFPVFHYLPEFAQAHWVWWHHQLESMMPSNHLILCCSLLLLPSIFPRIRVFGNESALLIRLPKYWSFSFSISPFSECSRLISFRVDCLDLLAVQGTLNILL